MLRGNFPAKVDTQARLKIPSAHRRIIEEHYGCDLFVTSTDGKHVLVYPMAEWEQIEARLLEPPKMTPAKMKFLRNTGYFGQAATMDRQGRVVVPQLLREAAGIDGDVVVIGFLNHLQVWNRDRFAELLQAEPYTQEDAFALGELGI